MATIRDVASKSGVSTATVSNVLNSRTDKVSAETRDRVMAVVRELRYRPTALEQNQKAILTRNLGVMAMDLTESPLLRHGYFLGALDGILEAAAFRGWSTTIFVEKMWGDVGLAIRSQYDGRCDGLIMIAPNWESEAMKSLQERGVPLVLIGSSAKLPGVSSIDIDNEDAGRQVARHLFELGHRSFGYLGSDPKTPSSVERCAGFLTELEALGVAKEDMRTVYCRDYSRDTDAVDMMLKGSGNRPTGIFAWHDSLASVVVDYAIEHGMRIPQDIAVVGVNDDYQPVDGAPSMTSFSQSVPLYGRRGANLLIDKLTSGDMSGEVIKFKTPILVRGSTDPNHKQFVSNSRQYSTAAISSNGGTI